MKRLLPMLIVLVFVSCAKKEDERPPEPAAALEEEIFDLGKAVIGKPGEIVSTAAHIDIDFRDPVIPSHLEGTILDRNPFSFSPEIKGHSEWVSRKKLRFVPAERLPAGQRIEGVLRGRIAFGEGRNASDFQFSFKVAEQEVMGIVADFVPEPEAKHQVRYVGTIEFAQAVDIDKIREDLDVTDEQRSIEVEVQRAEQPNRVQIRSGVMPRADRGRRVTVYLPGRHTADNKDWRHFAYLPAIDVFRVLDHSDMTDPDADVLTYGFRFNEPIKQDVDLSGFVSIDTELPHNIRVSGKYLFIEGDFTPGLLYEVTIAEGFPSVYGTKLETDYRKSFSLNNIKPEIQWLDDGVYLPTDNAYKLQFKSVNVSRVRIVVTEIYAQNVGFFLQRNALTGASAPSRDGYSRLDYNDLSRVGKAIFDQRLALTDEINKWIRTELDLTSVFRGKESSVFVVNMEFGPDDLTGSCASSRDNLTEGDLFYEGDDYYSDPCRPGYYYWHGSLSKLLIASNVGLTVKKADSGMHVFATDVLTARPISGLRLELFAFQNELLETQTSDADGHVFFSQTGSYILGRRGTGIALINDRHPQWQINNFDVSGGTGGNEGTNVFIYADRGVHRPGDTIHLSAIVRIQRDVPPEKHPVMLIVKNPLGQTVHEGKTQAGKNGHVYFPIKTGMSDPTGDWTAELTVGEQKFSKRLRVETVKPFRLKVNLDAPDEIHAPETILRGKIDAKYLFGAPASNHKAEVKMDLSERPFIADDYPDFMFSTPTKKFSDMSLTAFQGALDAAGSRQFRFELTGISGAPQLVQATLITKVFETGGSFTTRTNVATIYPHSAFVGMKNVFKARSALIGEDYAVPIIVLDPDGVPVAGHTLKVSVYVNTRHWWWEYGRRDQKDFRKMESTYLAGEYTYLSQETPVTHMISVEDMGRHLIEVTDETSGHQAGLFFYGSRWAYMPTAEEEPNLLKLTSDRNVYNVGDEATITFETPEAGIALLTIEQGDRLIGREWKPVEAKQTSFVFPITGELTPNCYASVSLIQPHNQNTNDLPMRLYGIKTLYVEEPSTRLPLAMKVPEEIGPREEFEVEVTSAAQRTASYTIAVVDEGLLDITAFDTPSPWDHFFEKIRLGVVTFDNYDQILGVLYPDIDRYLSIGGGMLDLERQKRVDKTEAQRFKPVILFKEPTEIDPGRTLRTKFTMPNYVGSVRIMVIGTAGNSYASLEETVPVRQPLMVLPTVPRVARPGDSFALPVSVFSTDSTIAGAEVSLSLDGMLEAAGPTTSRVEFAKPGERDVSFTVEVGDAVGAGKITVKAVSGAHKADYEVDLPVTSPNPFYTEVTDTVAVEGTPIVLVPEKFGIKGTSRARVAFTGVPDIQLQKRLAFLIHYPYGCIEQTVSSGFPQLFLPGLVDLKTHQKQAVTDHVNATIKRLSKFQLQNGFTFWPTSREREADYSDWGSSYSGHFLVEAQALGYHVPEQLYSHWLKDARRKAKAVNKNNHRYQAYRLFVLALAGEPHLGAMNLLHENYLASLDPLSRMLLAASYHLSGSEDVARAIRESSQTVPADYRELSGTYGSALRDRALMAYLAVKMGDVRTASFLLREVAESFRPGGWYSTQETAMAVLCIGKYYEAVPSTGGAVSFSMKIGEESERNLKLDGYQMVVELDDAWGKEVKIVNKSGNTLFVTLLEEGVPLKSRVRTESNGINLARHFYDDRGRQIDITRRRQGESFWVVYTVISRHSVTLEDMALTSLFPSGWEIINTRLVDEGLPGWIKKLNVTAGEYMDVRDDRVNWFFDLGAQPARFAVKLNPAFKGAYVLPPVVAEPMYSPEFYARIAGGTVHVE